MDKIILKQMEFYGYHGVFPEEKKLGQRFIVDLELTIDLKKAGMTDDIEETVNYGEAFHYTKNVVEGKSYQLIEAVAEKIAHDILEAFSKVIECKVTVIKPDPPIPGHYQHVAIEIIRGRS